jgi:hypothetical protein
MCRLERRAKRILQLNYVYVEFLIIFVNQQLFRSKKPLRFCPQFVWNACKYFWLHILGDSKLL